MENLEQLLNEKGVKHLTISFLKGQLFFDFLVEDLKIQTIMAEALEKFPKESERLTDFFLYVFLHLIMDDKFRAAQFFNRKFIDLLSQKRDCIKKSIEENDERIQIFLQFMTRFVSGLEISFFSAHQIPFFLDALCFAAKCSDSLFCIFEALLGLTRFTGEEDAHNYLIWHDKGMKNSLQEFVEDENNLVKTAAIELAQNLILNQRVCDEFFKHSSCKAILLHIREILKIFLRQSDRVFKEEDLRYGKDGYLFKTCLTFAVCVCNVHVESKISFKKQVNVVALKMFIERAFPDE